MEKMCYLQGLLGESVLIWTDLFQYKRSSRQLNSGPYETNVYAEGIKYFQKQQQSDNGQD